MKEGKFSKFVVGLLLSFVLAVSVNGNSELTLPTQAEEKAELNTDDMKFLSNCDPNEFIKITVTDAQAAEMLVTVNEVTQYAKTDYEKARALYQWLVKNVEYEAGYGEISAEAYGVFVDRRAVCGGFANLYRELLNLAGIPAVAESGYYTGYAHAWNALYADGRWFYADGTDAGGGHFDLPGMVNTHKALEIQNVNLPLGDLIIGFYNGTAVVGTQKGVKTIDVPEKYGDLEIVSLSYRLFSTEYDVEEVNIGANISYVATDTMRSSDKLKFISVDEENTNYASRDGVLFTKDMKELLVYPKMCDADSFTIPKETTVLDVKEAFGNVNLKEVKVEEGNPEYSAYEGALYNADQSELQLVPAGKTFVVIPADAGISDMAFANVDRDNFVIYGTPGSYAETFAGWYNITFVDINELEETPADKSRLENLVNGALTDFSEYTEESAKAYQDALSAAREVLTDKNATQEEVDEAYNALFAAVAALEEKEEPVDPPVEDEVVRLYGSGRYETGYAVADALKEVLGVEKFGAVVVATGKNFADALAGSYLAVEKNAPILLTSGKDDNVAQLHAYIKENVAEGGKVYILGGEAAVPAAVEAIEGYDVVRLFGDSRYDTNIAILKEAGVSGDSIIVATGKTFADSLSASAAKLPILLVKPNASLNDAQKEILAGMKNIYIVGGEGAVSIAYADELAVYGEVTRVFGSSRYDTSVEIAKTFCKDVTKAVVASGKNFPDGLCGGPLAAALNAPLVLTKDGGAAAAAGYVAEKGIASGFVLGGDGALTDETIVNVFGLTSSEEIVK